MESFSPFGKQKIISTDKLSKYNYIFQADLKT